MGLVYLYFFFFLLFLALFIIIISIFIRDNKYIDEEKLRGFECGFDIYISNNNGVSVRFFLILFLVFDTELLLLLPYRCVSYFCCGRFNYLIINISLVILVYLGLIYEWLEGNLDWL